MDKVKIFCDQWNDLTGAEIALLYLYDAWASAYDKYETENELFRQGKLAGQPVYKLPKF